MELTVSHEEMSKRKLMIGTPMYGGQCYGEYAKSMMSLVRRCMEMGVHMQGNFLSNESLIQRARNYVVDEFMRSDCTHLLFIDADVSFDPQDVMFMLAMMSDDSPYDVLCGPYPKKCISWEKIKVAVNKGVADKEPNELENYVGDYVVNPKPGQPDLPITEPLQILEAGTGFMMIRRETLDRYRLASPHLSYKPDHVRSEHFDGSREIHAYFDCVIDPESKRYLSEDYFFCQNVWKMGMSVWLCPWIQLKHTGTYTFGGSLAHLMAIGVDPTAAAIIEKKADILNQAAIPVVLPLPGKKPKATRKPK